MKISQKTLKVTAIAVLFLATISSGCKDKNVGVEGECPIVVSTNPVNLATGVPLNQTISIIFNTDMNPQTINAAAFNLQGPNPKLANKSASNNAVAAPLQGTVTYDEVTKSMIFTPAANLPPNTIFTATVNRSVTDVMGNALQEPYIWSFSTGAVSIIPPVITTTDPLNLATDVALNKVISATFDQAMDPLTITGTSFTLMDGTTPVAGQVNYSNNKAIFTPTSSLLSNTDYTAKITTAVKNPAGVALANDSVWTFKTATATAIPPVIASTDPLNSATDVALNKVISATFDQAMDPLTITGTSFTLMDGTNPVAGQVNYSGNTATFTPNNDLLSDTDYTANITTAVKNVSGVALASDSVWTFKTLLVPVVVSTDPFNLATGVTLNKVISATFNQAMDPSTITGTSFTLMNGTTAVAGQVNYSSNKATFTPTSSLLSDTDYTAKITTSVKNPDGVALASDSVWTFKTLLVPLVVSTDPLNLAVGVTLNKVLTATFNQAMDPLTITSTSFTLMNGTTSVAGSVSYLGNTATFTPSSNLSSGDSYIATITTDAKTPGGVALENDYIWTFDTVAPLGPIKIDLDCAEPFATIAGSTITSTGPSIINGDVALSPGSALVGFPPGIINGVQQITTPDAANAKGCLTVAFNDGQGRSLNAISLPGQLGGLTLAPGLYSNSSSSGISGTGPNGILTLDAQGDKNAVWIFQMSSTLDTDPGTSIVLAGDAQAKNIFWIVGTSATLGTNSVFYGSILAETAITLNTGAVLNGRALARSAAVSLDASTINNP